VYDEPSAERVTYTAWPSCCAPVPPIPAKQPTFHWLVPPGETPANVMSALTDPSSVPLKGTVTSPTTFEILLAIEPSA